MVAETRSEAIQHLCIEKAILIAAPIEIAFEAMLDEAESSYSSAEVPANSKVSRIASFKSRLSAKINEVELSTEGDDQSESDDDLKKWRESA